jgi:hypothetical protein
MNRYCWIYISAIAVFTLLSCKEDQPRPKDSGSLDSSQNEIDPFTDTLFLDSLLNKLLDLQNKVVAAPKKTETMKRLIASSHDTIAACMYIVGEAVSIPDSTGEINPVKAKRFAKVSAEHWALMVKSWINGTKIPYGTVIQGKVLYCRELLERRKEDTLVVLYMVPVGSAVVK